jgi:hypothetical protein
MNYISKWSIFSESQTYVFDVIGFLRNFIPALLSSQNNLYNSLLLCIPFNLILLFLKILRLFAVFLVSLLAFFEKQTNKLR